MVKETVGAARERVGVRRRDRVKENTYENVRNLNLGIYFIELIFIIIFPSSSGKTDFQVGVNDTSAFSIPI